jgi:hypothetical protein
MQEQAYVHAFAVQVPWWAGVLILVAIALGVWKLAKILLALVSD